MSEEKKKGRGGARPGAGLKGWSGGKNMKTCTFYLPEVTIEKLKRLSEAHGVPRGRVIANLVESAPEE